MPCSLNLVILCGMAAMGEDGVVRARLIRAVRASATGHGERMGQFRAALGDKKIVPFPYPVDVRALRETTSHAVPDGTGRGKLIPGGRVYLAEGYLPAGVTHKVAFAVFKEKGRVYPGLIQINWLRPRPGWIFSRHVEILADGSVGGYHIKQAVMIPYGGGVYAGP
jgi:hypothetical protein